MFNYLKFIRNEDESISPDKCMVEYTKEEYALEFGETSSYTPVFIKHGLRSGTNITNDIAYMISCQLGSGIRDINTILKQIGFEINPKNIDLIKRIGNKESFSDISDMFFKEIIFPRRVNMTDFTEEQIHTIGRLLAEETSYKEICKAIGLEYCVHLKKVIGEFKSGKRHKDIISLYLNFEDLAPRVIGTEATFLREFKENETIRISDDEYGVLLEAFLDVPKFRYLITNKGNVYNLRMQSYMKFKTDNKYYRLTLQTNSPNNNDRYEGMFLVHRLVAMAFVPKTDEDIRLNRDIVNHKDGNSYNNVPENLEWCTLASNALYSNINGLISTTVDDERTKQIRTICKLLKDTPNPTARLILDMAGMEFNNNTRTLVCSIANKSKWSRISDEYFTEPIRFSRLNPVREKRGW